MLEEVTNFLVGKQTVSNKAEIARQNRLAIHYLAIGGIPVGLANIAAQVSVVGRDAASVYNLTLVAYFFLLFLLDRFVIPQDCPHATTVSYLVEAPVMLIAILLGTIWDPTHDAITFLLFMVIIPVFILDRPLRVMAVSTAWTLLFLAIGLSCKAPQIWLHDYAHALEFLFSAMAVTLVVLRLRLEVIENLDLTRYHLVHDSLTDTLNHEGLDERMQSYVGKQLFLAMGDVDHLALVNDFYGSELGNQVLVAFADTLKAEFGPQNVFRLGGDALLCVGVDMDEQEGVEHIETCRNSLALKTFDEISTSYSFGFVSGTPQNEDIVKDMVQLTNINVHKAHYSRDSSNVGGPFSDEALREGIEASAVVARANSYEISQLTGLPTMTYFINRAEEIMSIHSDSTLRVVIGYFKIASFREFNDRNGYAKGDLVLRTLATLLKEALPDRHIAYLSGSRFVAFCFREEVEPAMQLLSSRLREELPEYDLQVRAGFALHHKGDSIISLIDQAKLAHDNVVPEGDINYRFYDAELDREIRLRHHLVSHIDRAVELNWLLIHYQPIISSETGKICALEALSRWNDPIYGLLPPNQFISVLEDESIIYKLSKSVVRRVLSDIQMVESLGLPMLPVSVNLSRKDFFECDMVEEITTMVDAAGLPHSVLSIEITESAFVESTDIIKREVARLRERGFDVWMDDFGSEYSSLNLLQELEFDLVKVDMRFMRNFSAGSKSATIVASIIDMCGQLGLATLVEGVEDREQYDALKRMGAKHLQGYHFSPPRPLPDLIGNAKSNGWL